MSELDTQLNAKRNKFEKLCIPTMDGFNLIELDTIIYMQADNAYTNIFLSSNERIVSTRNLGYYEKTMAEEPFLRVHNSFIVNMRKVIRYIKGDEGYVVLDNKKIIKVARSRRDELFSFFNIATV